MFCFSIVLGRDDDFKDIMKQNVVLENLAGVKHDNAIPKKAIGTITDIESSRQIPGSKI